MVSLGKLKGVLSLLAWFEFSEGSGSMRGSSCLSFFVVVMEASDLPKVGYRKALPLRSILGPTVLLPLQLVWHSSEFSNLDYLLCY